ncbi:MAG: VOC family protein [Candidatus Methanofastidiosa archaeon]|nr:VOC family protein [Candidatus Methanofastidiosa archaeon]
MIPDLRFHHLGIATRSINDVAKMYMKFGYTMSTIKVESTQNVRISFLSKSGSPTIELVEPTTDNTPITRIIRQSGTTPYHICYEVDNIEETILELESLDFRLLFEPISSEAMENGLFCYLFSPTIGLIELFQRKASKK